MYVSDGSNEKIHVFDRQSLTELTSFGDGGRQPGQFYAVHSIATDSKGNVYTTETYRGQRVQRFNYKGVYNMAAHALARRAMPERAALIGGLAAALDPALVAYTPAIMTEGVTASLLTIAVFLAAFVRDARGRARSLA